jgi:hypothetical protein
LGEKLSGLGALLVILGVISALLQLVGFELRILRALNEQGSAVAWGVRIGLIVLGAALFFLFGKGGDDKKKEKKKE